MRRASLEILRCPSCLGHMDGVEPGTDEVTEGRLLCHPEGIEYPILGGIPQLLAEDRRVHVRAFAESYSEAWARDGWGSSDPEYYLQLPGRDLSGRHSTEWRVKARSMEGLFKVLDRVQPARVLDLGCGMGWLSHHLALRGIEVYAMDVSLDGRVGLGAASLLADIGPPFERIWGEMERPPFVDGAFDGVICNASLHYALDVEGVLEQAARVTRPAGFLIVMNSPVYRRRADAQRALVDFQARLRRLGAGDVVASSYHHFDEATLIGAMDRYFGPVREEPFEPGHMFRWFRAAKGLLLGMQLASFPLLAARRQSRREPEARVETTPPSFKLSRPRPP